MMAGEDIEGEGDPSPQQPTAKRRRVEHRAPPQPVCILPARAIPEAGGDATRVVTLRHPGSGKPAQFILTGGPIVEVYELATFSDSISRSWFAHDAVISNGDLQIGTVVDPVLLALPLLSRARDNSESFVLLDHILDDDTYPEYAALEHCEDIYTRVANVCDVRGTDEVRAYRLNDDKLMQWLKQKVDRVAAKLETSQISSITSAALASNFAAAKSKPTHIQLMRYAAGVIAEYLPPVFTDKLMQTLGLDAVPEPVTERQKKVVPTGPIAEPLEDYSTSTSKLVPKKAPSVIQKKLSKIDTKGMKSLSSFFTKKK